MRADTLGLHGGGDGFADGASAVPVFQTAAYGYATAKELADVFEGRAPGYIYTRIANPTTHSLERRISAMEGGVGCIATSSGMAAITAVAMGLLRGGDEIVAAKGIFGGTVSLFVNTLGRFGVTTRWVDAARVEEVEAVVGKNTGMIFVEAIGNPRMDVPDVEALSAVAKSASVPLVVDSTVVTPVLFKAKDFGADIVIHSTSKYINGHGTAIGGAIVDTGGYDWRGGKFADIAKIAKRAGGLAFLAFLRNVIYRDLGGCAGPMNSFLMLQGLETLGGRMEKHCDNALRLAEFLREQKQVRWVNYPGLADNKFNGIVKKQFGGKGGGLLTFGIGSKDEAFAFIDSLKLAMNLANLGDAKTLVIHPASTIFHEFSAEENAEMGVTDEIVRVSVGIEDFADIRDDFGRALKD